MIPPARDFRLIPIVLLATISLFALKVSGLVFDGGYTLAERLQAATNRHADHDAGERAGLSEDRRGRQAGHARRRGTEQSWAQEMFNFNDGAAAMSPVRPVRRKSRASRPQGER